MWGVYCTATAGAKEIHNSLTRCGVQKKKKVLFWLRLRCELFSVKDPTGNLFTSTAGLLLCGCPLSSKPYFLVALLPTSPKAVGIACALHLQIHIHPPHYKQTCSPENQTGKIKQSRKRLRHQGFFSLRVSQSGNETLFWRRDVGSNKGKEGGIICEGELGVSFWRVTSPPSGDVDKVLGGGGEHVGAEQQKEPRSIQSSWFCFHVEQRRV